MFDVPYTATGQRVDATLASLIPELSRARVQSLLRNGAITLDGALWQPSARVQGGEQVSVTFTKRDPNNWVAQSLPLDVIAVDDDVIVINKPAGLVVHPGAGNADGTLVNALLAKFPEVRALPRAGIVHRLDKDTTGIMVAARSELAHQHLVAALAAREVRREYFAIVRGVPTAGATIDAPIGRHPRVRTRMAVVGGGRPALTTFRVAEKFAHFAALRVRLSTGRTHQIRVHMAHVGFPLVGDTAYARRTRAVAGLAPAAMEHVQRFARQALHAHTLAFVHPRSGEEVTYTAPVPADLTGLLETLRLTDAGATEMSQEKS